MKIQLIIGIIVMALLFSPMATAQEMTVSDRDDNVLMQVNDEGDAGSLTLPQSAAVPAETVDKLYNVGGVLFWNDAQLGTGWTRTGTNVCLTNAGDNVGIGVADPDARLEINGQIKITGGSPGTGKFLISDAVGLAGWQTVFKPIADWIGGNQEFEVTKNYGYYDNVRTVSITVPTSGKVLVSASGTVAFKSTGWDVVIIGITRNGDPNSNWTAENDLWNHATFVTDCNCTDATDQYTSWSNQHGFSVGAGVHTFTLWGCKYSSSSAISLYDTNMFVEFYPN